MSALGRHWMRSMRVQSRRRHEVRIRSTFMSRPIFQSARSSASSRCPRRFATSPSADRTFSACISPRAVRSSNSRSKRRALAHSFNRTFNAARSRILEAKAAESHHISEYIPLRRKGRKGQRLEVKIIRKNTYPPLQTWRLFALASRISGSESFELPRSLRGPSKFSTMVIPNGCRFIYTFDLS